MYCMILCPGAVPDVVKPSSPSYATALRSPPSSKPSEEKERAAFARAVALADQRWQAERRREEAERRAKEDEEMRKSKGRKRRRVAKDDIPVAIMASSNVDLDGEKDKDKNMKPSSVGGGSDNTTTTTNICKKKTTGGRSPPLGIEGRVEKLERRRLRNRHSAKRSREQRRQDMMSMRDRIAELERGHEQALRDVLRLQVALGEATVGRVEEEKGGCPAREEVGGMLMDDNGDGGKGRTILERGEGDDEGEEDDNGLLGVLDVIGFGDDINNNNGDSERRYHHRHHGLLVFGAEEGDDDGGGELDVFAETVGHALRDMARLRREEQEENMSFGAEYDEEEVRAAFCGQRKG